jgi:hypothetical protein
MGNKHLNDIVFDAGESEFVNEVSDFLRGYNLNWRLGGSVKRDTPAGAHRRYQEIRFTGIKTKRPGIEKGGRASREDLRRMAQGEKGTYDWKVEDLFAITQDWNQKGNFKVNSPKTTTPIVLIYASYIC